MARPKEFDKEQALDAAIGLFREHGFEGTSADMLVHAMKIGRQSLYDTFGDKWQLYCSALRRYTAVETQAHVAALRSAPRAIDGINAMIERVVSNARHACLGVNAICEFGRTQRDSTAIRDAAERTLRAAIVGHVRQAQGEGDIASDLDPDHIATFLSASFAGIRIAARGGAKAEQLRALGQLAMRALR
jgi:TetR/AcrR family transcriptional regulator, transcriptional repressor for nem operon